MFVAIFIILLIALSILFVKSVIEDNSEKQNVEPRKATSDILAEHKRYLEIQEKVYKNPIVIEHYNNYEQIEMQYSVLYNLKAFFSPEMDSLIELCQRDISIFSDFKKIYSKYNEEMPLSWGSFKRLAIIYEKRKEYDKAIAVCQEAIDKGMIEDGTKGKMYGRLARLLKYTQSNIPKTVFDSAAEELKASISRSKVQN